MKCQRKYQWVKLPRNCLPQGKGVLGHWARLAARAAYRKGIATYCGYENEVLPGMWAGGVVGLKSILGTRSRRTALETLEQLQELGYLSYSLDPATKKLEYTLLDWVSNCSGQACRDQGVYALQGTGFLCLPRNIPDRLVGTCSRKRTPGWICGATRSGRSPRISFHTWRLRSSTGPWVPF